MKVKFSAICLALAFIFFCTPIHALTEEVLPTEPETVTISTEAEWQEFCSGSETNANATVILNGDFSTNGTQFPVRFTGSLHGNGHTVSVGAAGKPLFADLAGNIRDLTIGTNNVKADKITQSSPSMPCGALAGTISGNTDLTNVINQAYVLSAQKGGYIGGLIGSISGDGVTVTLTGCANRYDAENGICMKAASGYAGGLIGAVTGNEVSLVLESCNNYGSVSSFNGKQTSQGIHGGLIGLWNSPNGSLTFNRCINYGSVSSKDPVAGFLARGPQTLEGNTLAIRFFKCANKGGITGTNVPAKSIFAPAAGLISSTCANELVLDSCYNSADITNETGTVGFAAGMAVNTLATEVRMENCYQSGTVSSANEAPGCFAVSEIENGITDSALKIGIDNFDLSAGNASFEVLRNLDHGTLYTPTGELVWENARTLTTFSGASVRTNVPTGLRFETSLSKSVYEELCKTYSNVTVGTLIAPSLYVTEAGDFTAKALDALGHPVNYLDVVAAEFYRDNGSTLVFTGSVVNIMEKHYQLDYTARGYIRYTDESGQEVTIYADYEDHCFSRTVHDVAVQALADPEAGLSDAARDVLRKIVKSVSKQQL